MRLDRCSRLDLFGWAYFKDVFVVIEDLIIIVSLPFVRVDEIISYFNNIVAVINMAIYDRVET